MVRMIVFAGLALALVANADQTYYYVKEDISCTQHEATGITNCEPGHLPNAEPVNTDGLRNGKRGPSCSVSVGPIAGCGLHCWWDNCWTGYCDKGVCHCTDCV